MTDTLHRHDISDHAAWQLLEPYLPGRTGVWGGVAKYNRHDTQSILDLAKEGNMKTVIPANKNGWSSALMASIFTGCAAWWKISSCA